MDIKLNYAQSNFMMDNTNPFPMFVGGFGSGKSFSATLKLMQMFLRDSPCDIVIFGPSHDILRLVSRPYVESFLTEAGIEYEYNKQESTYTVDGHGKIILRSYANPELIVGFNVTHGLVEELDTVKTAHADAAWNKMIARVRIPVTEEAYPNQLLTCTTPEGYKFCYQKWAEDIEDSVSKGYVMYKGSTYNNPHVTSQYVTNLENTYPSNLVAAYLGGEFVNMESGTVYDFVREEHFTEMVYDPLIHRKLHIGMDFNVLGMSATVAVEKDPAAPVSIGGLNAVDVLIDVKDTPSMINLILNKYSNHEITVYPDASGKNTSSKSASVSDVSMLKKHFKVKRNNKNPPIKDRVMAVNAALDHGKFSVNVKEAKPLVGSMEQQIFDKNGMPEKFSGKGSTIDDINDSMGYMIHHLMPIRKPTMKTGSNMMYGIHSR